jgi:hypothetical protein
MPKIVGNTVGVPNPKSDWNQTDATKADYIMNKPDLDIYATKKELEAIKANGGGGGGGVSQEYVDNALLPKIEMWQPNTEYKVGDVVLGKIIDDMDYPPTARTAVLTCIQAHTSEDVISYRTWRNYWNAYDITATYDDKGNLISSTYEPIRFGYHTIRMGPYNGYVELDNGVDTYRVERGFTSGTINIITTEQGNTGSAVVYDRYCYKCFEPLTSLTIEPLDVPEDFDTTWCCEVVFTAGDNALITVICYGFNITWSGEDCGADGSFYPQPNTTYEILFKKIGNILSARVGTIVLPSEGA